MIANPDVVTLDYNDLLAGVDLREQIAKAFGLDGYGLLTGNEALSVMYLPFSGI